MSNVSQYLRRLSVVLVGILSISIANAQNDLIFQMQVDRPMSEVYDKVYTSLEDAGFFVVFEPNIGKNLAGFAKKWGGDYNQNALSGLRSMVFCNAWYANKVSNKDTDLLGLCPLHISLFEREGKTTILFNKPTIFSTNSPARVIILEIENKVIAAIKKAGTD